MLRSMSVAIPNYRMTPDEYLAFEAASEERHEYVDGEIFAMSGTTTAHNDLVGAIAELLRPMLRGGPCRLQTESIKLRVESTNRYYYPDAFVTCDPRDHADELVKRHASVIIEVLSDSTEAYDRGEKFHSYAKLESLQEYVLVDSRRVRVDVIRRGEGGLWHIQPLEAGGVIELQSVGIRIPVSELYADVRLPATPTP